MPLYHLRASLHTVRPGQNITHGFNIGGIFGGIFGGSRFISNLYANSNGAKREALSGVGDQVLIAILFAGGHVLKDHMNAMVRNVYDTELARRLPDVSEQISQMVNHAVVSILKKLKIILDLQLM